MYSTNITETEKRFGYKISQMPNPELGHIGEPVMVDAVIYELDKTNIIAKVDWLDNGVRYSHQRLMATSVDHLDNWKPVNSPISDPAMAIEVARGRLKV